MKFIFTLFCLTFIIQLKSQTVTTVAGSASPGSTNGSVATAKFYGPNGVCVDSKGYLYVADVENHQIRKIDLAAGTVTTIAGSVSGFADGISLATKFNRPTELTSDSARSIYVTDFLNNKIRKIDTLGNVTTFAGSGASGSLDGSALSASFLHPAGVFFKKGICYVGDFDNSKIRKVVSGVVSTISGNAGVGFADGPVSTAKFSSPYGLKVDKLGNIIIADRVNHKVRKIDPLGNVTTIAGSSVGYLDGPGLTAKFNTPTDVCVDTLGNIYVADGYNHKVRKIDALGNVTTIAGSSAGFADGIGVAAQFNAVASVILNKTENIIYVADYSNNRVRQILLHTLVESGVESGNGSVLGGGSSNTGAGTTGINELELLNSFSVYPNPTVNTLFLSRLISAEKIEITNTLGAIVYGNNNNNEYISEIDIKNLSEGIYFIKVSINNTSRIVKFVKTN